MDILDEVVDAIEGTIEAMDDATDFVSVGRIENRIIVRMVSGETFALVAYAIPGEL